VLFIASAILALELGAHGALAHASDSAHPVAAAMHCTVIERVGVGLDLGTPFLTTHARDHCLTTDSATGTALTISTWALQLLA
jgi:hypothetical protein